jgi:adenylate cyclase
MRTRIGLNSGEAVVGNMGSQTRFNYTMMGDSVNLASRLESGAKAYGVSTLVTESTKLACEAQGDQCVFRFIDRIVVKGRTQPVSIFELVGLRSALLATTLDSVDVFSRGIEAYANRDWEKAIRLFDRAAELEEVLPGDAGAVTHSTVYRRRCEHLKANPPVPDWDGVWVMQTK